MAKFLDLEGLNYFWAKIKSWVLERFAYKSDLNQKLNTLVSGQNIKTINGLDITGPGNIEIQGGSSAVDSVNGKTGEVVLNAEDVGALPDSTTIPTKVSDLTNDSSFSSVSIDRKVLTGTNIADITIDNITTLLFAPQGGGDGEENIIESISVNGTQLTVTNKNVDIAVPTKTSDLNNDSGFITGFTETDPTVPSWAKQPNKPSYNYSEIGNTPTIPVVPTNVSAFNNDAGYATTQDLDNSKVFWAEVDVTTFAEIQDAIDAGRTVMLKDEDGYIYVLIYIDDTCATFSFSSGEERFIKTYNVSEDDSWELLYINGIESQNNRVNSISSSSDDDHYPSAKAVYDIVSTKYTKPLNGIPASDLESGVIPTVPVQDVTVGGTSVVNNGTAVIPAIPDTSDFEASANKVSTISGNETNINKYPNTKAVADALGKWGVVSQTQTWNTTNALSTTPRTYTMSDKVYGNIPQANIDLYVSAGATFKPYDANDSTSGYFSLNGLTDISYEEMQAIYARYNPNPWTNTQGMLAFVGSRTNMPPKNNIITVTSFSGLRLAYASGSKIECIIVFDADKKAQINNMQLAFFNLYYLSKVIGIIDVTNSTNFQQAFEKCYSLEEIYLYKVKANVSFEYCSLLSKDSLLYLIDNASTTNFTVTLHSSVYAKTQSGGDWYSDVSTALSSHTNVTIASA